MKGLSAAGIVLAVASTAVPARADTLKVPSEPYPTIQHAVNAAEAGDVIVVGPGEYADSVVVSGKTDLEIRGKGWPVVLPSGEGPGFSLVGCENVLLTGFVVDGGTDGVYLADAVSARLIRLRLLNSVESAVETSTCTDVLVSRCQIAGGADGISDFVSSGLRIEKCSIEGTVGDAMDLSTLAGEGPGSDGAVVTRNRLTGVDMGIRFAGEDAEISKNRIEGYGEYGIEIVAGTSSDRTVLSKNRLAGGTGAVGIKVNEGQVTVSGNSLVGGAIYFDGAFHVAEGNRVADAIWGVYMSGNDGRIAGNRITGAQAFGIRSNGTATTVEGNTLAGVDGHGIEIGGNASSIAGNRVSGATGNGIDITGTGNTVTGNRATGSGGVDLRDHNVMGVNTYEDNRFGTVEFEPVDV
jgi:parallel beta-helix repeat protein